MSDKYCQACTVEGVITPTDPGLSALPLCTHHAQEWHQFSASSPALFQWAAHFRHLADQQHAALAELHQDQAAREAEFKAERTARENRIIELTFQLAALPPLLARAQAILTAAGELL